MRSILLTSLFLTFYCSVHCQIRPQVVDSARWYVKARQFEKAESVLSKEKLRLEAIHGRQDSVYLDCLSLLAQLYEKSGEYEKEKTQLLEVREGRRQIKGGGDLDYALACENLGLFYYYRNDMARAEPLLLEALPIRERSEGKQTIHYAHTCTNLANVYLGETKYEQSGPLFEEAKDILERVAGKESIDFVVACTNLTTYYVQSGRYDQAEALLLEAREIQEKNGRKETRETALICQHLGGLYLFAGVYDKAEPLFIEDKEITERVLGKDHPDYVDACRNLGSLYIITKQPEKAFPLLLETKQLQERSGGTDNAEYAGTCENLGVLYEQSGEMQKAEPLLVEAVRIEEKVAGREDPDYATVCLNLGGLYTELGEYAKAEPLVLLAKEVEAKVKGRHHPDYGTACTGLGNLYWKTGRPELAEKEWKEAFAITKNTLSSLFQFSSSKEKAAYLQNVLSLDDNLFSFYVSTHWRSDMPYILSLFHRNLILSSSEALQKELFFSKDTSLKREFADWVSIRKLIAQKQASPDVGQKEDLRGIEDSANRLEKNLNRSTGFRRQLGASDWKEVRDHLKAGEAAIEFISFRYESGWRKSDSIFYAASVVRKDSTLPETIFLFQEKQLQELLAATGNKMTNDGAKALYGSRGGSVTNALALSGSIYDLIWKPLEKELKGIRTIYFAPAGLLHRIAFAALPVSTNELLSDRYRLIQLSSTAGVRNDEPAYVRKGDRIILYGGIRYGADSAMRSHFEFLPGTETEIAAIGARARKAGIPVSALSGAQATEESFKALDGDTSVSVIHIATHGFFIPDSGAVKLSDDPLFRSGLLFAGANKGWREKAAEGREDGILTAYEVSNMYLPHTKLVVLSACETALGDIQGSEGVYGLQRAFEIAGAQNLLMSLWKVPDAETAEFMQALYKKLFAGRSIADAFYEAQAALKNRYRSDPYKWAAWVLVR